jgi:trigger factor
MPELNDELAKEVGQESVAALKEHIRQVLSGQYEEASKREMRDELLDSLSDKIKLSLPETLVAQELELARSDARRNGSEDEFDEKKERREAERRVRLGLILAEWGAANKVVVGQEDLQRAVWAEAGRYSDPKAVFDFYSKNPNAIAMLRGMLFEQKALDAMLEKVKTKEKNVKPAELFKQKDAK